MLVGFVAISSWAILAILTSVISDNMIATSSRMLDEDEVAERDLENVLTERHLNMIFLEFDKRQTGRISERDWEVINGDVGLSREIMEASGADSVEELQTAFDDLCEEEEDEVHNTPTDEVYVDGVHERHKRSSTAHTTGHSLDAISVSATLAGKKPLILYYEKFIKFFQAKEEPVDKQCIMQVLSRVEQLEGQLHKHINHFEKVETGILKKMQGLAENK